MSEAGGKVQISLRAPPETVEKFDRIAKLLERDRSWVMDRAFQHYLSEEGGADFPGS